MSKDLVVGLRTCNSCGTVYFGVSLKAAKTEVRRFNKYFNSLSERAKKTYSKGKLENYLKCYCGNDFTNFRDTKEGDCPDGVTISPIVIPSKP